MCACVCVYVEKIWISGFLKEGNTFNCRRFRVPFDCYDMESLSWFNQSLSDFEQTFEKEAKILNAIEGGNQTKWWTWTSSKPQANFQICVYSSSTVSITHIFIFLYEPFLLKENYYHHECRHSLSVVDDPPSSWKPPDLSTSSCPILVINCHPCAITLISQWWRIFNY